MKFNQIYLVAILSASAVLYGGGCANLPPRTVAFKTLASVGSAVDASMKMYAHACAMQRVSSEKQKEIDRVHDQQFNPAFEAAIRAARFDLTRAAPEEVTALALKLIQLIEVSTQ